MEFQPFPKIARLNRDIVVTEKIDGTNAQIYITYANEIGPEGLDPRCDEAVFQNTYALAFKDGMMITAGSRNRWLTVKEDNFGFAKWVQDNADALFGLGEGHHYGEWWGQGIQRGYGLTEKRFSLFNAARWTNDDDRPACCSVVPTLYAGMFDEGYIKMALTVLQNDGSRSAPGFMDPEGIVVYHTAARQLFKVTLKNDEVPKGQVA